MAQSGFTPIQLYFSTTASAAPSAGNLANGELALNITDGKLFYKDNGGVVQVLATKAGASGDVVGPGSSTDNALVRFDSTTGKLVQNSVGILDDSGNLTGIAALTTSGALTLNGGTANGVAYLNGSKVLTTGSALQFDGTNLGLGVTPSASWQAGRVAFQIQRASSGGGICLHTAAGTQANLGANYYFDGTNARYLVSAAATSFDQLNGGFAWYTAPSGTAGNAISFTQAMTLDASGNLMLGTTTQQGRMHVSVNGVAARFTRTNNTDQFIEITGGDGAGVSSINANYVLALQTGGTERARIDSSGNLLVGVSSGSNHIFSKNAGNGAGTTNIFEIQNAGSDVVAIFLSGTSYGTSNSAGTSLRIGRSNTTSRSINAGGTINASGADYAEYMTKASDFTVAKGDVLGINADGKLTNVFADAVSFCVKSTDPSYVGNDKWGCDFSDDPDGLEAARQLVDRIAFAGQVPVNVMGATPGQYIVPVIDNGAIKGIAKNEADMTLAEYMKAVGKVIAIEADGRAKIIVKVA